MIVSRTPPGHIGLSGDMELPQMGDESWLGGGEGWGLAGVREVSVDNVMAHSQGHRFRAAGDAEFGQDVADVGLDR